MFAGSRLLLPISTNFVTLVPKPGRKEGHAVREPSLLRGIAVLRRLGSRKKRRPPVAARGCGAGAMEEQVGRKARCRAPGTRRGGWVREGAEESAPFASGPEPAAIRQVGGGAGNGGLAAGCPRLEECQAVHQRCPVPSHGTTSKSRSLCEWASWTSRACEKWIRAQTAVCLTWWSVYLAPGAVRLGQFPQFGHALLHLSSLRLLMLELLLPCCVERQLPKQWCLKPHWNFVPHSLSTLNSLLPLSNGVNVLHFIKINFIYK